MAPIGPSDVLIPKGPLQMVLFPGLQSTEAAALIEGWITRAYLKAEVVAVTDETTKDALATAYVIHLAYMRRYDEMLMLATSVNVAEKGSTSFEIGQMDRIKALADHYLAEFDALLPIPTNDPLPPSTTVRVFLTA